MTAQPLQTAPVKSDPHWEKRLKLAEDLDAQGVYPPAWTKAQRAPWRDQESYRQTGSYDASRHFLARGQLYDRANPDLTPSRAQAEESLKAYVGEPRKPVAETVPVHEVPLEHPAGRPYIPASKAEAEEKAKLLARQGVNHRTWRDGDALPSDLDQWIKTNGYKTSDIYQGPDDYHYRHNDITRTEEPEVTALRLKHNGERKMQDIAEGPDPAEPHVVRHITDDWLKEARAEQRGLDARKAQTGTPVQAAARPVNDNQPAEAPSPIPEAAAKRIRETAAALDKLKADAALSPSEFQTLSELQDKLDRTGAKIELRDIDPKTLMPAAEKLATQKTVSTHDIGAPLLAGTAATAEIAGLAGAGELAGAGTVSALSEIVATLLAPEIVLPAAAVLGGAGLLVKYGTPPDGTRGAGRVWATKRSIDTMEELTKPVPAPEPPKPIDAGKPDLGGNPVPDIPLVPEQLPIPDFLEPLINVIPAGPGTFIKPTILPGWDSVPEELDPNVYRRKGSAETQRRAEACREVAAKIYENLGYKVEKRWGADQPEHYFPNAQTGKVQGSSWSDAGLLMLSPIGQPVSWHLSTYTMNPKTGEAVTEEVTKAIRLIRNWIGLINTNLPLSKKVADAYDWYKGAFSMVAKGKKGAQYDQEFMEECERQIRAQINEDGTLKPSSSYLPGSSND